MKQAEIRQLLPEIFQRAVHPGNPLFAALAVMELLQAPSEGVLQNLETFFDPRRCPDGFVPYLASWVDLDRLLSTTPVLASAPKNSLPPSAFPTGLGRLRELVAAAPYLSRWRGTARGLMTFLEIVTGQSGFVVEEQPLGDDGLPRPFHLRIQAPAMEPSARTLVGKIIELEKPAYVTYELVFTAETGDAPTAPVVAAPVPVAPEPPQPGPTPAAPGSTPVEPAPGPVTVSTGEITLPPSTASAPVVPPAGFVPPVFRPRLQVVSTGQEIPIPPGPALVGRNDPANAVQVQLDLNNLDTTKTVSRRHATITFDQGNFYLTEQLNVSNGTFINGQRLKAGVPARLADGDQVKFGAFETLFRTT